MTIVELVVSVLFAGVLCSVRDGGNGAPFNAGPRVPQSGLGRQRGGLRHNFGSGPPHSVGAPTVSNGRR